MKARCNCYDHAAVLEHASPRTAGPAATARQPGGMEHIPGFFFALFCYKEIIDSELNPSGDPLPPCHLYAPLGSGAAEAAPRQEGAGVSQRRQDRPGGDAFLALCREGIQSSE